MDILNENDIKKLETDFKNKIVLVGYTAKAKGLYDLRPTPFNKNEAGIQELQEKWRERGKFVFDNGIDSEIGRTD